ncbi:MAG: chromosome segregation protein SMC [Coriobacteriia bacterium]|nr:chromosome segregation protein SMC [Coriobacteriia bacterium]
MHLKSLTIRGFKSFADRTVVNFEAGMAAIVGPNGAGKSNISEAVLWALGEQRVTNLRVQAMEELIFSGSSAREPVGVAEVELVLDNSDGTLPIEFDQVAIARRMYRNGESEYSINGAPCRRMDIIDILFDSGLGQGAHSIIGQGNLTAVLDSKPEDRRALVEEAAGILKHKRRKERASRKLMAMDATLTRVMDLVRIIESQLKPLERQAARAEQYQSLNEELKSLDLSLAVDDLRNLRSDWNILDKREREVQVEAELAHYRLNEREAELARRQRALEEKGLFVGDLNEQRIRCQSIIQRLSSGMLVLEEKGKNLVDRLSDLRATRYSLISRLSGARIEYADLSERLAEGLAVNRALNSEYSELARASEAAIKNLRQAEEEHDKAFSSLRSKNTALDTASLSLTKALESLGSLEIEQGLIDDQAKQLEADIVGTQAMLVERRQRLDDFEQRLAAEQALANQTKAEVDKRVRLLDDRRTSLSEERDKLMSIQAEMRVLEEIDRAFEAASPALTWVRENSERFTGIIGRLSESLTVREGAELPFGMDTVQAETLVERLLGADLYILLVEDSNAARLIAEALLEFESQGGELALMPLGLHFASPRLSPRGNRLIDLLDYPAEQAEAIEALLGDVYLVESIAEAQKNQIRDRAGVRFVTPQGAVAWPNGKLTVGIQIADVDSVLERRRRMDNLGAEQITTTDALGDAELELSKAEKVLVEAQTEDFESAKRIAKLTGDADATREDLGRIEESLTQLLFKKEGNERRLQDIHMRRLTSEPMISELNERIADLNDSIILTQDQVAAAEIVLARCNEERAAIAERLSECKLRLESASGSAGYLSSRHAALEHEITELEQSQEALSATEKALDLTAKRTSPLYEIYEQLHAGASTWAERLRDQAQLEQSDSKNLRDVIDEAAQAVEGVRGDLAAINDRLTEIRIEKARMENEVEHAINRIVVENNTPLELALEAPPPSDRQLAIDKASQIRRKLSTMGAVNQVAAEEFEALRARRDFVLAQIEDLSEARKALARIERALDRKMRNLFLETFEQVNRNFQEVFSILFPGGFGQLLLTEGESPELSGVEVSAQPKGKRITKLSLMSGGEKALTAIALLFAVYRIRKAPFYILDEVDAALDDINLQRLIAYFDTLRESTQLILVTHQRRTMESADMLYGVTMQAAGVSRLISQRLDQALRYAGDEASSKD